VLASAFTIVEADPKELVTTPRPISSLFVPSSAARALEILVAVRQFQRWIRGIQAVKTVRINPA